MANTYHQIFVHIIFAVANREAKIRPVWKNSLYKYIGGGITNHDHKMIAIGGVENHVHILIGMNPKESISDLVRSIKIQSSKWINDRYYCGTAKFSWQKGYGAFTYGRSQLDDVIKYINRQEQHHKGEPLSAEFRRILEKYGGVFDYRYMFEDV